MKKKRFILEILRFVCFCKTCRFQNLWHHHKHCCIMQVTLMFNFFWTLSPIKIKFGQILVCCMTNISNMFLAECWRLETSSRLFYDFIKMSIQQDLAIFNGWHIPFLIVLYSSFQKMKHWNLGIFGDWVIRAGC